MELRDDWLEILKIALTIGLMIVGIVLIIVLWKYGAYVKADPCEACKNLGYICSKTMIP